MEDFFEGSSYSCATSSRKHTKRREREFKRCRDTSKARAIVLEIFGGDTHLTEEEVIRRLNEMKVKCSHCQVLQLLNKEGRILHGIKKKVVYKVKEDLS